MTLKSLMIAAALSLTLWATGPAFAGDVHVNGYYRSNGTYVQPYTRSAPESTVTNNYSFEGNVNPYTGSVGTNRDEHDATSPYFNGRPDSNGRIGHSGGLYGQGGGQDDNSLGR